MGLSDIIKNDKAVKNSLVVFFSLAGIIFVAYILFFLKPALAEIKDIIMLILGIGIGYVARVNGHG